jgi:predicted RNase H-like HicB family nuclease
MSITKKPKQRRDMTAIDRPFSPGILRRARAIAERYQVVMWFEDGEYYGRGVELPGAGGDGKTPDECMASSRESFTALVAYMLEAGQTPPQPLSTAVKSPSII